MAVSLAVVLLATDRQAYGRLSRLITIGRRNAPKGEFQLSFDELAAHAEGSIAGIVGPATVEEVLGYREVFGNRCYLLAELQLRSDRAEARAQIRQALALNPLDPQIQALAKRLDVPVEPPA